MRTAIILAAGKGTRMRSNQPKVVHDILQKPMLAHVVDHLREAQVERIIAIVGHEADKVKECVTGVEFVYQNEQLGTGHAVLQAEQLLADVDGNTMVICGDTPLIYAETIENIFNYHEAQRAKATILTAQVDNPTGYGRIIRDQTEHVLGSVEEKDASPQERLIQEINTGTYCFAIKELFWALNQVTNDNAQGEYYLPDVLKILADADYPVRGYKTNDFEQTLGINDRVALANAERIMRERINTYWMREGVTIINPDSTYIGSDVKIGSDTVIYPNTHIYGKSVIGSDVVIGPDCYIHESTIADYAYVHQSVIHDSSVGSYTSVGPYAHLRNNTAVGEHVRVGNFVEMKNTQFGDHSGSAHLAYLGDAEVGERVNIGCGSITVNYDGEKKHKTIIGNDAFVGCNSNLIAPIEIGSNAYIAAGSTLTDDVPENALAIARERQTNKAGYAEKLKPKKK